MLTSVLYFTCKLQLFCIPLWWCLTLLLSALIKAKLCKPSKHASKHARSDPASYGQCAARIGLDSIYAGSDFLHPFQLRFFPKKTWIILCKTDLGLIWMAWSGFGQTYLVWKQTGVQKSPGPVSGRRQVACHQFPTFRFVFVHPQTSWITLRKTSLDLI